MKEFASTWNLLEMGNGEADHDQGDWIIKSMLNMDMSEIEIMSVISTGIYRINRLRKRINEGENWNPLVRKSSAFTVNTIAFLHSHMESWQPLLEQGFPCPHFRLKTYFIDKTTWTDRCKLYSKAHSELPEAQRKNDDIQLMAYSTFTMHVHYKNPGTLINVSILLYNPFSEIIL